MDITLEITSTNGLDTHIKYRTFYINNARQVKAGSTLIGVTRKIDHTGFHIVAVSENI